MTSFPTSYSRAPTLIFSQSSLNSLGRTSYSLARLNERPVTDRNGALVGHIRGYAPN